jgi:predicted RND superfamily exporter protein
LKNWIINQAIGRPVLTIVVSILITLLFGSGVLFVVIDDDFMRMLPEDIQSRVIWDEIQDEFGTTDFIFVAFGKRGEPAFNPAAMKVLWDVTRALEDLPEVDEVISMATMNRLEGSEGFLEVDDLMSRRILSEEEIKEISEYLDRYPDIKARLVGKKGDFTSLMVRPKAGVNYRVLAEKVTGTAKKYLRGYDVHFGGQPYITGSVPVIIRDDVSRLVRIGLVIMVIILLANLRSAAAVSMIVGVIALSALAMMGFMGWMVRLTGSERFYFAVINSSMPIILLTIANSDGVHIITRFFREFRRSGDVKHSVRATMNALMLPVFLTSITTMAAFITLMSSPIKPMYGYGVTIAFGISWAWFLSVTFLPALMFLKRWKMESAAVKHKSVLEVVVRWIGGKVIYHTKAVLILGLAIVLVSAIGIFMVKVEVNITSFFKPGNIIRDSADFLDEEFTGSMNMVVSAKGDIKDPDTLNKVLLIQNYLEGNPSVTTTFSIADVIKQMHRVVMDDMPEYEVVPETRGKVNNLFTLYSMSGDPEDFSALVDYDYGSGLVTAMLRTASTSKIVGIVKGLEEYIAENIEGLGVEITGMTVFLRDFVRLVVRSSITSILISILLVFVISWIFFRSALWGIMSVIPLSSAVILNFGIMGLLGIELSHVIALLTSIIIGVGIDFAVHYIAQFRNFSAEGTGMDVLSREVVDDVGYPILLDVASNMGFAALMFSSFVPLNYMGGLVVLSMFSCSLGTLTLLASLTELMKARLVGKNITGKELS